MGFDRVNEKQIKLGDNLDCKGQELTNLTGVRKNVTEYTITGDGDTIPVGNANIVHATATATNTTANWDVTLGNGSYDGQQLTLILEAVAVDTEWAMSGMTLSIDISMYTIWAIEAIDDTLRSHAIYHLVWDSTTSEWQKPFEGVKRIGAVASGDYANAEGAYTTASGSDSHAEGYSTTASGAYGSHAEGDSSEATGTSAHAEGIGTTASGSGSHTEGNSTTASGDYGSHAEGYITTASGNGSHAEGNSSIADHDYESAHGRSSISTFGDAQNSKTHFENRTIDATQTVLNNAFTVATDTVYTFEILVSAIRQDVRGEMASYKLQGCIYNNGGTGTTAIKGTVTKTVIHEDNAAWDVTAEANDTDDTLEIKVTGEAGKTIHWSAACYLCKVAGSP